MPAFISRGIFACGSSVPLTLLACLCLVPWTAAMTFGSFQASGTPGSCQGTALFAATSLVSGQCSSNRILTCAVNGDVTYTEYTNTGCTGAVTAVAAGSTNGTGCMQYFAAGTWTKDMRAYCPPGSTGASTNPNTDASYQTNAALTGDSIISNIRSYRTADCSGASEYFPSVPNGGCVTDPGTGFIGLSRKFRCQTVASGVQQDVQAWYQSTANCPATARIDHPVGFRISNPTGCITLWEGPAVVGSYTFTCGATLVPESSSSAAAVSSSAAAASSSADSALSSSSSAAASSVSSSSMGGDVGTSTAPACTPGASCSAHGAASIGMASFFSALGLLWAMMQSV